MENERAKMIEAFAALLEKKPFDSITAKAVTERAGLPASAFAYCFHDTYALADAYFEEERRAVTDSGLSAQGGGEAFLLSVSFAIRSPSSARNVALSSAAGIYKRSVSILASKYFSDVVLAAIAPREPEERDRNAVKFLRAAAVGLATRELISAENVTEETEKYTDLFDILTDNYS